MFDDVIKTRLNARLRPNVRAWEWELLNRRGLTETLRNADTGLGDAALDDELTFVVGFIKDLRATVPVGDVHDSTDPEQTLAPSDITETKRLKMSMQSAAYARALSENVAARAKRDRQANAFRSTHLRSGLITFDQVQEWIEEQVRTQSPETRWARLPIPVGWEPHEPLPARKAHVSVDLLDYIVPGATHVARVAVAPNGTLARLRRLAQGLAAAYGWEPAQAVTWVLTGITPLIGLIRITEGGEVIRDFELMEWAERITLTVHPAVKPEEVQSAFSDARDALVHRRSGSVRRARAQSIPHLILARFIAGDIGGGTWDERRSKWNRWVEVHRTDDEFKEVNLKRYDDASQFKRDATVACQRVLHFGSYTGPGSGTAAATDFAADPERTGISEEEWMVLHAAATTEHGLETHPGRAGG
jgi:hypothetical protein